MVVTVKPETSAGRLSGNRTFQIIWKRLAPLLWLLQSRLYRLHESNFDHASIKGAAEIINAGKEPLTPDILPKIIFVKGINRTIKIINGIERKIFTKWPLANTVIGSKSLFCLTFQKVVVLKSALKWRPL